MFGQKLSENPLQLDVLKDQEIRVRGNLALVLQTAVLLGKVENQKASKEE